MCAMYIMLCVNHLLNKTELPVHLEVSVMSSCIDNGERHIWFPCWRAQNIPILFS